MGGCKL
jgi:hypothetical protein